MSTFDQPNKTTTAEKILEMQPSPNLNTLFFISEKKKNPNILQQHKLLNVATLNTLLFY